MREILLRLYAMFVLAFRNFAGNVRGAVTATSVVGIAMALLVFAYLFPVAMTGITGANTTGWDTAVTTIFGTVLAILAIVGVALQFLPKKG